MLSVSVLNRKTCIFIRLLTLLFFQIMPNYRFFLVLLFVFCSPFLRAQCPVAPIAFNTQAELDAFAVDYPSCTFLPDGVDVEISGDDIVDLSVLSQLTGSFGAFEIRDCPNLTTLAGMENFTTIGNDALDGFILMDLDALSSVSALSNLETIVGEFTIRTCGSLEDLEGFEGLTSVEGSVIVRDNAILTSLLGFDNLTYIGETLELVENPMMTDISALSNVETIVGGPEGGVFIEDNASLASLEGLGTGDTSIGSNLDLLLNGSLSLCAVPSICNYLASPPEGAVITIDTNVEGCNTLEEIEDACATLSIVEVSSNRKNLRLVRNPVNEHLLLKSTLVQGVTVYDIYGNKVLLFQLREGTNSLYVNSLKSGLYFLQTDTKQVVKWVKS